MQEEVNQKTVALSIRAAKLSGKVLASAFQKVLGDCLLYTSAFYSKWLINRIRQGFVLVRNPYNPMQVTRYRLSPDVVDLIVFCTKNPEPMLTYMEILKPYGQYWFVTITPYGRRCV